MGRTHGLERKSIISVATGFQSSLAMIILNVDPKNILHHDLYLPCCCACSMKCLVVTADSADHFDRYHCFSSHCLVLLLLLLFVKTYILCLAVQLGLDLTPP